MPIMEALMTLSFVASATSRIGLGTEVLVLPQRQPVLVAKQVATLDTLSGGRVRLGVGVGWQESEYDALEEPFGNRGKRMDEAIELMRAYWGDERIDYTGAHYSSTAMAMEPKPPQGRDLPVWVGGTVERALRRVGELGDGWLANAIADAAIARKCRDKIGRYAEAAGRDPNAHRLPADAGPAAAGRHRQGVLRGPRSGRAPRRRGRGDGFRVVCPERDRDLPGGLPQHRRDAGHPRGRCTTRFARRRGRPTR